MVNALTIVSIGVLAPPRFAKLALVQALCFLAGRMLYAFAYKRNVLGRFTGFVMGWYAALVSAVASLAFLMLYRL